MDRSVEKLTEKAKNLEIHDKSAMNWCHLPIEMKEEVVKHVDFKSSLRLRLTAREERKLVDSRKFELANVSVNVYEYDGEIGGLVSVMEKNRENEEQADENNSIFDLSQNRHWKTDIVPFLTHILKIGNIDQFCFDSFDAFIVELLNSLNFGFIRIKNLEMTCFGHLCSAADLRRKIEGIMDSVTIHCVDPYTDSRWFNLSNIFNARSVEFHFGQGTFGRLEFSQISMEFAFQEKLIGASVSFRVFPGETILEIPMAELHRHVVNGDRLPTNDQSMDVLFEIGEVQEFFGEEFQEVMIEVVRAENLN